MLVMTKTATKSACVKNKVCKKWYRKQKCFLLKFSTASSDCFKGQDNADKSRYQSVLLVYCTFRPYKRSICVKIAILCNGSRVNSICQDVFFVNPALLKNMTFCIEFLVTLTTGRKLSTSLTLTFKVFNG